MASVTLAYWLRFRKTPRVVAMAIVSLLPIAASTQVDLPPASGTTLTISTARFDSARAGANTRETHLTPSNVAVGKFGLLCQMAVDGDLYSQPLFIPNVNGHDLVIATTMKNFVYAFDANGCRRAWRTNLGTPWQYPNYPHIVEDPLQYRHEIGASNATVDPIGRWVYTVTVDNSGEWALQKLDLDSGAAALHRTISGQVTGSGDPMTGNEPGFPWDSDTARGGELSFNGSQQLQRTALLLSADGSTIYIGFGSLADIHPYHGWVFAYKTADLSLKAVFCTTPSGSGGGVWNGGGGITLLPGGDLIFSTGNGTWDGVTAFGQSILRLNGSTLSLVDWYTPSNWSAMNANDSDLGSGPVMLIPGTNRLVTGAKDSRIYDLDYNCLGHLGGSRNGCGPVQVFYINQALTPTGHAGVYNGTFWNGAAYFPTTSGSIYKFVSSSGLFNTTPTISRATYEFPGAQMAASSNGASDGIIWATTVSRSSPYSLVAGTLRALNPGDLSEYWNSDQTGHDKLGALSKYTAPTVANGRVYVSTQSGYVSMYGLLPPAQVTERIRPAGEAADPPNAPSR